MNDTSIFERLESEVRGYCRAFPTVFVAARESRIRDENGTEFIDFFSGAGALNYGHNPPQIQEKLVEYLSGDGIVHSLDMMTAPKRAFLQSFEEVVLKPRGMEYKVQFPGPTGTNSVEAALKLARKVTGRETVISFTNAFHGMTLGALAITGNAFKRGGAGIPLSHNNLMPFDGYFGEEVDTCDYLAQLIADAGSGMDLPAAVILETIQAEGGINVATANWLRRIQDVCREHGVLLIVDDIQVGCGRTGTFFSFEEMGIQPDLICLSKSLSGYGLPLAVTLIRPDLDLWEPGEHNGTFRGQNPSFITAAAALDYWRDDTLRKDVDRKGALVREQLEAFSEIFHAPSVARGRGLIQGIACGDPEDATAVCREAFTRGLLMETSGPESGVVKVLPPLVISDDDLAAGLEIARQSVRAVVESKRKAS